MNVLHPFTPSLQVSLLGRVSDTDLYEDLEEYTGLTPPPQVHIFRFQAPLYYANKESFLKSLYKAVGVEPFLELTKRRKAEKAKGKSSKQAKANKKNGDVFIGPIHKELDFHTIVLDCSAIPFIDSSGTATLKVLVKEYKDIGVSVLLACCNASVIDALRKAQVFGKNDREMSSLLFYTVHAAVFHAGQEHAEAAEGKSEDSLF